MAQSYTAQLAIQNRTHRKNILDLLWEKAGVYPQIVPLPKGIDPPQQVAQSLGDAKDILMPVDVLICDSELKLVLELAFDDAALKQARESSETSKTRERASAAARVAPFLVGVSKPHIIAVSPETTAYDVLREFRNLKNSEQRR